MNLQYFPIWKRGRPAELFASKADFISKFIAEHKIEPLSRDVVAQLTPLAGYALDDGGFIAQGPALRDDRQYFSRQDMSREARDELEVKMIKFPTFPGGLKTPHLHFKGEVFLLNHDQWREFSNFIVNDIQERVSQAESISFDQVMDLSAATSSF